MLQGLICVTTQNFIIMDQMIAIFFIFKMAAVCHIGFSLLKLLVAHQIDRYNMDHRTKFHQNQLNSCRDVVFNIFQSDGHPPCCIVLNMNFLIAGKVWRSNGSSCKILSKLAQKIYEILQFLPCEAMLSAVYAVILCLSVCLCVCHTSVLYQTG